jgi:hypothetical protein
MAEMFISQDERHDSIETGQAPCRVDPTGVTQLIGKIAA